MTAQTALATTQQLLDVLRPQQQPDRWFSQTQQINWDNFAVRAIAFGLAPQVHHILAQWQLPLPAKTMAKLAITHVKKKK